MRLNEIKMLLDAELLTFVDKPDLDIKYGFGCDLMSDVLAFVNGETLLLTGLTNVQTIRTAYMKDLSCIIFVRGKRPDESVIELAAEKGICLMCTKYILFNACGILYNAGLKGAGW